MSDRNTSPRVILVGPPGAGKTTIGRRLSRALSLPFVDSDELIEQAHGKDCGEVFSELGESAFRELEAATIERALHDQGVLSLGGGAVVTESTRTLLADHPVVWIEISAEEGVRRTSGNRRRPVLNATDPLEQYRNLLATREPFYREVANHRVRSDGQRPQRIVANILNFLDTL